KSARMPKLLPATRRGALPPTSPSCWSCCASLETGQGRRNGDEIHAQFGGGGQKKQRFVARFPLATDSLKRRAFSESLPGMSGRAAGRQVPELGYLSAATWVLSVMISISCASRSTLSRLMMSSFLLSSTTWLVVLF